MRSKSFDGMACSAAGVLDAMGDRWGILILRDIGFGVHRYEDLRKSTGVTNATLTSRLRHLEENGLVERCEYQSSPTRYEYHLTARGRDVSVVIFALVQTGDKWAITGDDGPPVRFINKATGSAIKLTLVDEKSGERVLMRDVRPKVGPGADKLARWRVSMFDADLKSRQGAA
jgi:DNA-binding HxlR family transcriptional regulator